MGSAGADSTLQAPVILPPAEFREQDSHYSRLLVEVLKLLSPFRGIPTEYDKSALAKAERRKHVQEAMQKSLTPAEKQQSFEEELNRGFRDWLVSSSTLRQVLDLVHLDVKQRQHTP